MLRMKENFHQIDQLKKFIGLFIASIDPSSRTVLLSFFTNLSTEKSIRSALITETDLLDICVNELEEHPEDLDDRPLNLLGLLINLISERSDPLSKV